MNWLQKFSSRRWLTAVAGVVFGAALAFGLSTPEELLSKGSENFGAIVELAKTIGGAITAVLSIMAYNKGEAKIDATRVENGK